jgi:hypothetical protein
VPKVQNNSAPVDTIDKQEGETIMRGQKEVEEGGTMNKGQEDMGERKPVESLAGEREHRVPNLTAPRLVHNNNFTIN